MDTKLQIDEKLLAEAKKIINSESEAETINHALDELIRQFKRKQLLELQGTIEYFDDRCFKADRQKR